MVVMIGMCSLLGAPACRTSNSPPGQEADRGATGHGETASQSADQKAGLEAGLRAVWAATDLDGEIVGEKAGVEATAVVVFASWCSPCRKELAMLGELRGERPGLRVIGVNYYEEFDDLSDEAKLRAFIAGTAPWLQVVRADQALFTALGRPSKIPTVFLFNGEGALIERYLRAERAPPTREELERALTDALM